MASSLGEGRRSLLLSFSEEGKDGGDDGSGDGTKVGSSSFSSAVGRVGVQACKPSLGKEVAVSVVSSFLQCSSVP